MRSAYLTKSISAATVRALNYTPEVEAFRKQGKTYRSGLCLGDLICGMAESYGKVFIRYDCAPGRGEELLTQSDMFAAETEGRIIRGDAIPRLEDHRLYRWQILIAGAGTLGETELYGRSIIVDERLAGKIIGPHAIRLTFPQPGDDINLFVYAFLCSPTGIRLVRSASFGTKILSLREDLLRSLPIPLPADDLLKKIGDLIRTTVTERERYLREVQAARACLEALPEMQEAIAMCQERKARCTLWDGELPTLNGWTYASTGRALSYLNEKYDTRLRDCIQENGLFRGPRFARVNCKSPYGVDFFSQRDIHLIRPIPARILKPNVPHNMLFVEKNTLLIPGMGQFSEGALFGKVAIATSETESAVMSELLFRVIALPEYALSLYAFLSTKLGLKLLRTVAVGNSIPTMRTDLIEALPVPILDSSTLQKVNLHVRRGLEASVNALVSEKEAVRIIEEEVLPEWLA